MPTPSPAKPKNPAYLVQRKGRSRFWHLRLQYPGELGALMGKTAEEKSLRTEDRRQAEIIAMPLIQRHKALLLRQQLGLLGTNLLEETEGEPLTVGNHTLPSGQRVFCSGEEVFFLDEAGGIERRIRNRPLITRRVRMELPNVPEFMAEAHGPKPAPVAKPIPRSIDDEVLETWIVQKGVSGYLEKEARATWALWRELCPDVTLATAKRADGRKLAMALLESGNKTATVTKKVGHLCSAVNIAIDDGLLSFNPFSKVIPKRDDSEQRFPLDDADMALCRANLHTLSPERRLLFLLLAHTGLRLSEALAIREEFTSPDGVRHVQIGKKTDQSLRKVPLPDAILPLLPKRIVGPLFTEPAKDIGRNLNRGFLRRIGITDTRKVLHSLRHRAKDRLRAAGCPIEVQYELLGHEEKTVAKGYGHGSPLALLKTWMEKIGA